MPTSSSAARSSRTWKAALRVSVVATGIEAESMQKATPNNVEPLRPHRRVTAPPLPVRPETKTPEVRAMASSPVHHHMETLHQELVHRQPVEQPMPVAHTAPIAEEEPAPVYHTVVRTAPVRQQHQPEPEEAPKRSRFGFLGRREKKPEPARIEPAQTQRQPQRASAQIIQRGTASEPQRGGDRNMEFRRRSFPGTQEGRSVRDPGLPAPPDKLTFGVLTALAL